MEPLDFGKLSPGGTDLKTMRALKKPSKARDASKAAHQALLLADHPQEVVSSALGSDTASENPQLRFPAPHNRHIPQRFNLQLLMRGSFGFRVNPTR